MLSGRKSVPEEEESSEEKQTNFSVAGVDSSI